MRELKEIGGYVLVELEGTEAQDYGYHFGVIKLDAYTGDIDMDHGYMEYDGMDSFDEAIEKLMGLLEDDAGENQGYRIGCLKGLEREGMAKVIDAMIKGANPPPEKRRLIHTNVARKTEPYPSREQCHSRNYRYPYSMRPCSDVLSRRRFTHKNQAVRAVCRKGDQKDQKPLRHVRYGVIAKGLNGFVPSICEGTLEEAATRRKELDKRDRCIWDTYVMPIPSSYDQDKLKGDVPLELGKRYGIIHSEVCGDFCYDMDTTSADRPVLFLHMLSEPRNGIPAHAMIRNILMLMAEHSGLNYAHVPVVLKENCRGYVGINLDAGPNGSVPYSLGNGVTDRKTAALVAAEKGICLIAKRGEGR